MRSIPVLALVASTFLFACGPSAPPNDPSGPPSNDGAPVSGTLPADATPAATEPAGAPSKIHPVGGACGGIAGFGCESGLYCAFAPDARCGAADQMGTCAKVPEMCTREYAPVCGCDGKTYGNACGAASAGVSVSQKGECKKK